jgi:hypothetical protein
MAEESRPKTPANDLTGEAAADDDDAKFVAEESKTDPSAKSEPTVREIFALPEKDTDPRSAEWKTFQERISKEVKGVKWTAAMPDLAEKVCELLDIKIPNILVAAWKKAKELQAALEKSKGAPEEVTYLQLAEHTVNSDHKPSINVQLKGATVKKIELPVQLAFNLKGFVLKIQNGGILEMQTGHCEAKGTIKYGTLVIAEKKLEPIKLPLTIPIPASIGFPIANPVSPVVTTASDKPAPPVERIEI